MKRAPIKYGHARKYPERGGGGMGPQFGRVPIGEESTLLL